MKLNAHKFAVAVAGAFALVWLICSVTVALLPEMAALITGSMMHADMSNIQWQIGVTQVLMGLIAWSLMSGAIAWVSAAIYNRALGKTVRN